MVNFKDISIYIHIPFCVKKCLYCDFLSFSELKSDSQNIHKEYVLRLVDEIKNWEYRNEYRVKTIFIGGGTPSAIDTELMKIILDTIFDNFDVMNNAEITIEANPGTIDFNKAVQYKKMGINRISLGLQAVQNDLLKKLGRIHSFEQFLDSYNAIRKAGFDNVNVDLMFALPTQSIEQWQESLEVISSLDVEHISAYSLIIEEGTPFFEISKNNPDFQTSDENDRIMYYKAKEILNKNGYNQYEISNFAKSGKECKHNLVYWQRGDYIGFGLGASSFVDSFRFKNTDEYKSYLNGAKYEGIEKIQGRDAYAEFMFLGLRMIDGISRQEFKKCFGVDIDSIYKKEIDKFINDGLLEQPDILGDRLRLTEKGIDVSNSVFIDFL